MAKAYLVARLNTDVFPPIVDRVMISSNAPGSMCDGKWVEIYSHESDDFHTASEIIRDIFQRPFMHASFPFVNKFLNASKNDRAEEINKQCLAAAHAIKLVEILNTPAVRL